MLEIRLLGNFDVRIGGEAIDIPSRPAQSLLAYLALSPGVGHRREKLAGLLWPEATESNARSNLRHALWRLRRAVGAECILADNLSVAFNQDLPFWLDAAELQHESPQEIDPDKMIRILSVYGGELLPGFYDDWAMLERERLRMLFERKVQVLLNKLIESSRWGDTLEWAERWIALGATPEPAYRALMLAYGGLGDVSGVAASYNRCCAALRDGLGVEISEESQAVYEYLSGGGRPPMPAWGKSVELEAKQGGAAVRALLHGWRERGAEMLDLASLAIVHAAPADVDLEAQDASLLIKSALHHGVDLEPWLVRAGSPQVASWALQEALDAYPQPRVRRQIVEALEGLNTEEANRSLLRVVEKDDSASVRSDAAVAAAKRGLANEVVERLLADLNQSGDPAALTAFVAVADELGLPKDVGPHPKFLVRLGLAQRRWKARRSDILRQAARAALAGAIAMTVVAVGPILPSALVNPGSYQEILEVVPLTVWLFTNTLLGVLWGGLVGASVGFSIGLADALWGGRAPLHARLPFASLAGLVHSAFILFTASASGSWADSPPGVYFPVYILYGILVGGALSIVVPELGTKASVRLQLARTAWTAAMVAFASAIAAYLAYEGNLQSESFIRDLILFMIYSILFPLAVALAFKRRRERRTRAREGDALM